MCNPYRAILHLFNSYYATQEMLRIEQQKYRLERAAIDKQLSEIQLQATRTVAYWIFVSKNPQDPISMPNSEAGWRDFASKVYLVGRIKMEDASRGYAEYKYILENIDQGYFAMVCAKYGRDAVLPGGIEYSVAPQSRMTNMAIMYEQRYLQSHREAIQAPVHTERERLVAIV